jgi:hypothetical protein
MDEPLTFGCFHHRKNACNYTIRQVAQRVAETIAEIRQFYPNAKMVDLRGGCIRSGNGHMA